MAVTLELSVSESVEPEDNHIPDISAFQSWADSACQAQQDVIASVQIVSREEMQDLNRTYRGKDKPTNVLSFPMQLPEELGMNMLGDLALCADVIEQEAAEQGKPASDHWAHMVVHGMLHLQGYDHVDDAEAEIMESKEINILNRLGIENPYTRERDHR